jgi:hypothetical protein
MAVNIEKIRDDLLAAVKAEVHDFGKFAEGYEAGVGAYFNVLAGAIRADTEQAEKPAEDTGKESTDDAG